MNMSIKSSAFSTQERIPEKYTADGKDVSPSLQWSGLPDEAESLALVCHDPDAPGGDWVHWVIYDISPAMDKLDEDIPADKVVAESARQGKNDFGEFGYGGPAPPPGKPHRYIFTLYALDQKTGLEPGATRDELLGTIDAHTISETSLTGLYQR